MFFRQAPQMVTVDDALPGRAGTNRPSTPTVSTGCWVPQSAGRGRKAPRCSTWQWGVSGEKRSISGSFRAW